MPVALNSDRQAIEVGLYSSLPSASPRVCRIRSTADLSDIWVSEALLDDIRREPGIVFDDPPRALPFDSNGNLFWF
jgi:hypothetical protein